jgi:hypothetical protein
MLHQQVRQQVHLTQLLQVPELPVQGLPWVREPVQEQELLLFYHKQLKQRQQLQRPK